jgi:poly(3-hydroxybutyrate) depolymerase
MPMHESRWSRRAAWAALFLSGMTLAACRRRATPAAEREAVADPLAALRAGCNGKTGLPSPLPVCTKDAPCTNLKREKITEPEQPAPACAPKKSRSFAAHDGPPLTWSDPASGAASRQACAYKPPRATAAEPRPLLVFVHGSEGNADSVYDMTELRAKAETFPLGGSAAAPGFFFASMHGRNLHFRGTSFDGPHWDTYFRDGASSSKNPDVRALDHVIDTLAAGGAVDPKRIYVMGWSNGAFFAHLYGIARSVTPTPGGHRVAAVVGFAGGDPFAGMEDTESPSCALDPYPSSDVPILDVHRTCDALVACDEAQRMKFHLPPGNPVQPWLSVFASRIGHARPTEVLLDQKDAPATACAPAAECTELKGLEGHMVWPVDVEPKMLEFLASHPRT